MLNSYFRSWKRGFHYEQCAWQVSGSHSARAEPVTAQGRAEIINRGNEASPLPVTACQLQAGGPPLSCSPRTACASRAAADRRAIAVRPLCCPLWLEMLGERRAVLLQPGRLQPQHPSSPGHGLEQMPQKIRQESIGCLTAYRCKYWAPVKVVCNNYQEWSAQTDLLHRSFY